MKRIKFLCLWVLFFSMVAVVCSCESDYLPETIRGSGLTLTLSPLPSPNSYGVLITWPGDESPDEWEIYRNETGGQPVLITKLVGSKRDFLDPSVEVGKTFQYELRALRDSSSSSVSTGEIAIPHDFEVKGVMASPPVIEAQRLFFHPDSKLITLGEDLRISVNQIHSEGGMIQTFPKEALAKQSTLGRSAGKIEIHASSGTGVLYIEGHGESGGAGVKGRDGAPGKKGAEGHYSLSTHEHVDVLCNCGEKEAKLAKTIQFGGIFERPAAMAEYVREQARHRCITQTGDGARGGDGEAGAAGTDGAAGGNSSLITVEITSPSELQVKASASPGAGGPGGKGGSGAPGGPGGDRGSRNLDRFKVCREAFPGPAGNFGANGPDGKRGADGSTLPVCIKSAQGHSGDCT